MVYDGHISASLYGFTAALDLDFKTTAHHLKLHEDGRHSARTDFSRLRSPAELAVCSAAVDIDDYGPVVTTGDNLSATC